ncbi:MAG: L,D-transpeptidase family protein [Bacillota bacterium]
MPHVPQYLAQYAGQAHITINVSSMTLALQVNGRHHATYPCAVGKPTTPSPIGSWQIALKTINPSWEVLGTRWMGLNVPWGNYGIHGTNAPWSIGRQISNGCIRMYNENAEEVYDLVAIGTPVDITGSYGASSGALRLGAIGHAVIELQNRLIALGYLTGFADGVFGSTTDAALKRFQVHNGLAPDGIAGPLTRRALGMW